MSQAHLKRIVKLGPITVHLDAVDFKGTDGVLKAALNIKMTADDESLLKPENSGIGDEQTPSAADKLLVILRKAIRDKEMTIIDDPTYQDGRFQEPEATDWLGKSATLHVADNMYAKLEKKIFSPGAVIAETKAFLESIAKALPPHAAAGEVNDEIDRLYVMAQCDIEPLLLEMLKEETKSLDPKEIHKAIEEVIREPKEAGKGLGGQEREKLITAVAEDIVASGNSEPNTIVESLEKHMPGEKKPVVIHFLAREIAEHVARRTEPHNHHAASY